MPLLSDAKTCYVGTQPITTIMAGSVQVWPKGPVLPGCYPPATAIGFYHFEDDLKNLEGSAPDFTVANSSFEFKDGQFGRCITSTDQRNPSQLTADVGSIIRPITIECWIKITEANSGDYLKIRYSSKDITDPNQDNEVNKISFNLLSTKITAYCGNFNDKGVGNAIVFNYEEANIRLGEWFHVAVAHDLSLNKQYFWVNGNFKGTSASPFDISKPLNHLTIDAGSSSYTTQPIQFDELRMSKEIIYPLHDIFPCSKAPDFEQVGMRLGNAQPGGDKSIIWFPVSWGVESSDCDLLPEYEARWGYSSNYPGGDGSTPPTTWRSWEPIWGSTALSVLDPVKRKIYWANPYAEMDHGGQGYYVWNEVREKESKKIVVPPCQTDVTASEIPYPYPAANC